MGVNITIEGETRNERRRILDLIDAALKEDGKYAFSGGKWPSDGDASSQSYSLIDKSKIFSDMSVAACMARYDADRERRLILIGEGRVSASMSGIEYYPFAAKDADIDRDPTPIKGAMTWNGQVNIRRDNWRQEFLEWRQSEWE